MWLNPKAPPLLRFYAVAIAMFTLFTSTDSLRGSHLPELYPPFTRTNRSPQSPILIVEMVYGWVETINILMYFMHGIIHM